MLSINDFSNFSLQKKLLTIFNEAKEIGSRKFGDFFIKLYLLENIFVEIWYLKEENKIDKVLITSFDKAVIDYSINIDISDIFK